MMMEYRNYAPIFEVNTRSFAKKITTKKNWIINSNFIRKPRNFTWLEEMIEVSNSSNFYVSKDEIRKPHRWFFSNLKDNEKLSRDLNFSTYPKYEHFEFKTHFHT